MRRFTRNETWLQMSKQVKNKWGQSTFLFNYFWQMYDLHTSINGLRGGAVNESRRISAPSLLFMTSTTEIFAVNKTCQRARYTAPPPKKQTYFHLTTPTPLRGIYVYMSYTKEAVNQGQKTHHGPLLSESYVWSLQQMSVCCCMQRPYSLNMSPLIAF